MRPCKDMIYFENEQIIKKVEHSHPPRVEKLRYIKKVSEIRELSIKTLLSSHEIILNAIKSDDGVTKIQKYTYLRDQINRHRNKENNFLPREFTLCIKIL